MPVEKPIQVEEAVAPIIVIKKRKAAAHGHHGGAWKVAYADFVTAMMCFFLVMWLMGADEEVKQAIENYFKDPGSASALTVFTSPSKGGEKVLPFDVRKPAGGKVIDFPAGRLSAMTEAQDELIQLEEMIDETISVELGVTTLSEKPEVIYDSRGLLLRIAVKSFFADGEVEPKADLIPIVYRIGKILAISKKMIRIEGHADKSESNPQGYNSAWELSTARAAWLAKYWLQKIPAINPNRIQVAGNSYNRPIGDGKTEEGRAQNRRLEIIVLNNSYTTDEEGDQK